MTPEALGSRYQLLERIGEGGLGVVWRGNHVLTGVAYAIKVLRPEYAQDPETVARFVRERTALLRFRHPNVVRLHDMIVEGDRLALVMDLIADGDLAGYRRGDGGTLGAKEASELMAQTCAALAAAHAAGIVHRDLKPANILLDAGEVRLTDFGIAQVAGEPTLTTQGAFLGTLHYLAPEVIQGGAVTSACDVYAVGVTLYELLAGQPPFRGLPAAVMYAHLNAAPERPDGIPDASWQLISACLDKDSSRRPGAAELESALRGGAWTPTATADSGWLLSSRWQAPLAGPPAAIWGDDTVAREAAPASGLLVEQTRAEGGQYAGALLGAADPARAGTGGDGGSAGGGAGGPGRPRRSPLWRGAWAGGVIALLAVAGVLAATLTRSPGSPHAGGPGVSVTVTHSVATAARTGSAASSATQSGVPGVTVSASPAGIKPSTKPGSTPGASPSVAPRKGVTPTPGGTPPGVRVSAPTVPSSAPASQLPSSSPPATTGSPSASVSPSPSTPANTAWECGPAEPATLYSNGKDTGQTLQACIRIHAGKLDLHGVLDGTVTSWKEQIVLVLKDSNQDNSGTYRSAVCTTADCVFTVTVTPASSGQWTVLPEWTRNSGNFQSAGAEPGFVSF